MLPRGTFLKTASPWDLLIGPLKLEIQLSAEGFLTSVRLPDAPPADFLPEHLALALAKLEEWPLPPAATKGEAQFRKSLACIPPGASASYGMLALSMGTSPRALASRCAANRFLLRIPCHRVVAKNGIGGYQLGTLWKTTLLAFEHQLAHRAS